MILFGEADRGPAGFGGPRVGGHHQHHMAEVRLAAVVVGQGAMVHHLEQQVEDVRVGLLDFVQQQDGMGIFVDLLRQQAALVEADVTRRGADEARHRVALHVLRHIEADQFQPQDPGKLTGHLRLAHARGTGEEEGADGLLLLPQAGAAHADGGGQGVDGRFLAEDHQFQIPVQVAQGLGIRGGDLLGRDAGDLGDDTLDVGNVDAFLAPRRGHELHMGTGLVDDVDGLVGQVAVVDVLGRQFRRGAEGRLGVADLVMFLEAGLEALEDQDRVLDAGLVDIDLLKTPGQGPVLLENAAKLLVGGRADTAQLPGGQDRLDQIGGVHDPARGRTGADDGVNLVDEQNGLGLALELGDDRLQALLEVAPVLGASHQGAQVQGIDDGIRQDLRHRLLDDPPCQALGDSGFAHPGLTHQQGVVLAPPAQGLDGALDLGIATDEGVDTAQARLLVEVGREILQGVGALLAPPFPLLSRLAGALFILPLTRDLGDPMGDVIHHIEPANVLTAEEVDRLGVLLTKKGHQDIRPGDLLLARGLDMEDGAL